MVALCTVLVTMIALAAHLYPIPPHTLLRVEPDVNHESRHHWEVQGGCADDDRVGLRRIQG